MPSLTIIIIIVKCFCDVCMCPTKASFIFFKGTSNAAVVEIYYSLSEVCCLRRRGEVQRSKLTDKYVRRRQRQNITMGGQPATPLEAV